MRRPGREVRRVASGLTSAAELGVGETGHELRVVSGEVRSGDKTVRSRVTQVNACLCVETGVRVETR